MTFWDDIASTDQVDANMCHLPVDDCLTRLQPIIDRPDGDILDLGCGIGRLTAPIADRKPASTIWAVDSSQELLALAAERNTRPNVHYILNNGASLAGLPTRCTAAFSVGVFQHIPDIAMRFYIEQVMARLVLRGVFVFQFVDSGESGPLSYPRSLGTVMPWVADYARVDSARDEENGWTWMTIVR